MKIIEAKPDCFYTFSVGALPKVRGAQARERVSFLTLINPSRCNSGSTSVTIEAALPCVSLNSEARCVCNCFLRRLRKWADKSQYSSSPIRFGWPKYWVSMPRLIGICFLASDSSVLEAQCSEIGQSLHFGLRFVQIVAPRSMIASCQERTCFIGRISVLIFSIVSFGNSSSCLDRFVILVSTRLTLISIADTGCSKANTRIAFAL